MSVFAFSLNSRLRASHGISRGYTFVEMLVALAMLDER